MTLAQMHRRRRVFFTRQQELYEAWRREMGWLAVRLQETRPFADWLRERGEPAAADWS